MEKFFKKIAKSFHSGESGFTLIELLIVIVILGVLAAAIIPNLSKFVGSGTVGAANAELASVRTAIGAYQADNNSFPCGTQPSGTGATNDQLVNNALLQGGTGYVQGTIKGLYKIDNTGVVLQAANGTWPTTIIFGLDSSGNLMWLKGTGAAATYAP